MEKDVLVSFLAFVAFSLTAFGEGLYEIYYWLRYGVKVGLSLVTMMPQNTFHSVYYPTEWIGLANIVKYIIETDLWKFFFSLAFIALLLFYFLIKLKEDW
ncbi:MAG: hypothetical protein ABSF90_25310 [Syntrophobacteraceae bacterium]|jgi:uncharacterized membrane protein